MPRLYDRAFRLLRAEAQRCAHEHPAGQVRLDIVLERLETLRQQEGEPLTEDEIREAVMDMLPNFRPQVIAAAARANRPARMAQLTQQLRWIGGIGVGLAALAGGVWVLNLPYPMIRWPVARTAPLILLPSYIQMDHSYRQAISLVEQADQLVNQATSAADLDLGTEKVEQADYHLDRLPVWFLGYYPRLYCNFFACGWSFTLDEFKQARQEVGRMEAKLFQEKNAQTDLDQGVTAVETAQQAYQQAQGPTQQAGAIANWQGGMDQLQEIPAVTLAGRMAATKLVAYQRDFQQVTGQVAGTTRSNTLIGAAKVFANQAAQNSQNPPHSATKWQQIAELWKEAIARLEEVPMEDPGFLEAQTLLAQYISNRDQILVRLQAEEDSVKAFDSAKVFTNHLLASNSPNPSQNISQLQAIVDQLQKVQPGTTVYSEAEPLLKSAQDKLNQANTPQ